MGTVFALEGDMHLDIDRVEDCIHLFLGLRTGHHDDQLYLSEFVAHKARQWLFNVDMDVEARNTVVVQATKLQNCTLEGRAP